MRTLRITSVIVAVAAATCLAMPGAAGAQETAIELTGEETGHCNPCHVFFASTDITVIQQHILGAESIRSTCSEELEFQFTEAGGGTVHSQRMLGAGCTEQACDSPGNTEWEIEDPGEISTDVAHLWIHRCLEPLGGGTERSCSVEFRLEEEDSEDHHEYLKVNDWRCEVIPGIAYTEVTGSLESTGEEEDVEITHL